jgi:4-hydroxy-tetrahydrodipicolinate synthase
MVKSIEGYVPAVVSPFNAAGELMLDDFVEIVRWHLASGVDGLCVAGDNGEAWALTPEDRRRLAEAAVREASGKVPVVMGASAPTARQTIAYAEIAAAAGVDAIMTGPQSYVLKATAKEIVSRFEAVHRAVPIPILLYNSPRRTGLNLELEVIGALCDALPVVGLKEASRDFFHVTNLLRVFRDRLSVLIGPAPFIFPGLALGARGFISSGPELFGEPARQIRALALEKPSQESRRLHFGLTRVYETLMSTGTWPAALKAALGLIGVPAGVPREPVEPLSTEDSARVEGVLRELGLLSTRDAAARSW